MSTVLSDISKDLLDGIFDVLDGHVTYSGTTYPVYKSVPKNAGANYVYVGGIDHYEEGTKEQFYYYGTVQVQIVTDNLMRADKLLAQNILNIVRGLLKPTKAAIFSIGSFTLVVFSHESFNEVIEINETGIVKVKLVDMYNFLIN